MTKKLALIPLLCAAVFCFSQEAPAVNGTVSKPGAIDVKTLKGLNRYKRLVKVADAQGKFLGSLELSGYALKDVLDRREVKKQDDGFNKPIDVYITAKGKNGRSALFSYGEVFLTDGEGVLLADQARMILPHRHPPLKAGKNDPTILLDVKRRDTINLNSCLDCHNESIQDALYFPKGWMIVAANDGFNGRFVEGVSEINVNQVGIEVKDTRYTGGRDGVVESPEIVGPDGKTHPFKLEDFQALPRILVEDAGVGMGTGFRGIRNWEGVPLKGLLSHLLPSGVDPRDTYVLVTAADGYRSLYSGSEVFNKLDEKCVLLIDRRNGEPLGVGSGRYAITQRVDFYLDRNVRMVKEIRLVAPKQ
jgi:hypothetical protein